MKVRTGNYLTKQGVSDTITIFQQVAYQILYGSYVDKKFRKEGVVHNFRDFNEAYKNNYPSVYKYDIAYYRITESEATTIIQFLNSGLELVCGVETIAEEEGFE